MSEKIPKGWKWVKLGEVAEVKLGQSPESKYYNDKGIGLPFLQGNKTFGYKYPEIDIFCSNPIKIAKKGEVLISVRAPVGDINIANQDICIGRGLASINSLFNQNEFLFYCLKYSKNDLLASETGTVFGSINKDTLNNFSILLPPLPEQKAIAEVLSSIDDKIDLLHRQNKTLEKIAMTLFKQWFIEPTKDGLPEGWEEVELSKLGQIVCGKTPSKNKPEYFGGKIPFIKIPDMHGNVFVFKTEDTLSEIGAKTQKNKTLPERSICVSCIATVGLVSMNAFISQTNQQINSIIPYKEFYRYFLYLKTKSMKEELIAMASGGTATLNLNTTEFSKIKIEIPKEDYLHAFHEKIKYIFEKIFINTSQIQTLEKLRDTLLPKLMSGEVRVRYDFKFIKKEV